MKGHPTRRFHVKSYGMSMVSIPVDIDRFVMITRLYVLAKMENVSESEGHWWESDTFTLGFK